MPIATIMERTFQFSRLILRPALELFNSSEGQIFGRQLLRSATSIGANVIEAQHSSTKQQFLQYYQIALRSAWETEYWIKLIIDFGLARKQLWVDILDESNQISRIIAPSIIHGKKNKN